MNESLIPVTIIGAGEIGQAIAGELKATGRCALTLWDSDPAKVPGEPALGAAIASAKYVFACVPSRAVRSLAGNIKHLLPAGAIVVSVSKGLEAETNLTSVQVWQEELPQHRLVVLGGPLIAEELAAGRRGVAVLAADNDDTLTGAAALFTGTHIAVEKSRDVRGVSLAGVIKNVYAIGLGAASVALPGHNFQGFFVTAACDEMRRLITALDGEALTACGTAGLGDLIATGFSEDSANHQAGREIAEKGSTERQSEGIVSLPQLLSLLGANLDHYPLLKSLKRIIVDHEPAAAILSSLP